MFRDYNNVRACLAIMIRVRTFVIVVAVFVVGFLFWTLTVFVCASARADEEKAILAIRSLWRERDAGVYSARFSDVSSCGRELLSTSRVDLSPRSFRHNERESN